jgi:hypothetical protein
MINNYTDEKSQQVYCIIDKGRTMKMAFEGLSLLDYAVNATLAMSSVLSPGRTGPDSLVSATSQAISTSQSPGYPNVRHRKCPL